VSLDVTQLANAVVDQQRWFALLMTCAAPRKFAFTGPNKPVVSVVYADGTTDILPALVVAAIAASSKLPTTHAPDGGAPFMLEFDRPKQPVSKATLTVSVQAVFFGPDPVLRVWLLDPPVNREPVRHGIAAGATRDAGLSAHPSIIGVHRIMDGTQLIDFCHTEPLANPNFNAIQAYDPAIYGTGPQDLSKLPHPGNGKWIGHDKDWSIVNSDYTAEGFEPLAPGIAALRVFREAEVTADDVVVGYALNRPVNAKIFMPPDKFGRLDEIFVRYYVRLGTMDGSPYVHDLSTRYQVRNAPGSKLIWTDCGGKAMIMPTHDTTPGGVSGTSGGGRGWQMRMGWGDIDLPAGPDVGGWGLSPHWYDYQRANPPGHHYGAGDLPDTEKGLGQIGGLGSVMYAHHWYCMEVRLKLNRVDQPASLPDGTPHVVNGVRQYWTPDGELQVWIDGRLAYDVRNKVFRSLPLHQENYAGRENIFLPPMGNLGVRDLWFNWFHGGLTKSSRSRVQFITGLAWGNEYIGPMAL
jgi:hypothetical protein